MPGLPREDALAFNDDHAEFQQGGTLIRVDFPLHGSPVEWLARASLAFDAIWADMPKMLAFAGTHLRTQEPARWRGCDAAGVGGQALTAFGIWIDPEDGSSSCLVSFDATLVLPPGLDAFPDDDVTVNRSPSGWLAIDGVAVAGVLFSPPQAAAVPPSLRLPLRCPCCRCKTLRKRAVYAICPVCFWEDEGQDDHDADVVYGGPNYELSLTQGQANYRAFGASRRKDLPHVRPPQPEELPDEG
jgi:Cysteine-rich CPCC